MARHCGCEGSGNKISTTSVGLLERPRYSPGLILEDSDLTSAVDYTRELNRLLFRSLFGCGVVCGLKVGVETGCGLEVTVATGLALDGCGDPIHLTAPVRLNLGEKALARGADPPKQTDLWVWACAGEKPCAQRTLVCDGDDLDGLRQPTRIRATTEISISFERPKCGCVYRPMADADDCNKLAERLLDDPDQRPPTATGQNAPDDREAQLADPDCPPDCGCGSACSCGCCVLLAWVHWFPPSDKTTGGWGVLHRGVRRFVRPCLSSRDPVGNTRPNPIAEPTTAVAAASAGGTVAKKAASKVKKQPSPSGAVALAPAAPIGPASESGLASESGTINPG